MKTAKTWRAAALGAVLSLVAVGLVPSAAVGVEEVPGASVVSVTDLASFKAAIANASDGTVIELANDLLVDEEVLIENAGHELTLDLNSKKMTVKGLRTLVAKNVNLTITGPGLIQADVMSNDIALRLLGTDDAVENYTVVNIGPGVEIDARIGIHMTNTVSGSVAYNNGMVANIDDAIIRGHDQALYVHGNIEEGDGPGESKFPPVFNIHGTHLFGNSAGMYLAGSARTTISNSTVEATGEAPGIEIRAGYLTVTETDVTGGIGEHDSDANPSGASSKNAAIAVMQHTTKQEISVTINGGTFTGGAALAIGNPQGNEIFSDVASVAVEGGTFQGRVVSTNAEGDPITGFISGGSFTEDVARAGFVNPDSAQLVRSGTPADGKYQVMTPEQARAAAGASVDVDGVEVFYEDAVEAATAAGDHDEVTAIHTVTFDLAGGEGTAVEQKIDEGDKVAKPADPTRAGYTFTGWNVGGLAYNFDDAVTGDITLTAAWKAEVTVPPVKPVTPVNLVDISSNKNSKNYTQFHRQIQWLANEGITKGWNMGGGKHEFRAKDEITRDAMAAFMYRFAGKPATSTPAVSPFSDVTPQKQFYKEIAWLSNSGISTGWKQSTGLEKNLKKRRCGSTEGLLS